MRSAVATVVAFRDSLDQGRGADDAGGRVQGLAEGPSGVVLQGRSAGSVWSSKRDSRLRCIASIMPDLAQLNGQLQHLACNCCYNLEIPVFHSKIGAEKQRGTGY